jgi:chorismate mutase / prephenate dehydratase
MSQQPVQSEALAGLRVQIDNIDQQLLALLNQRALVAEKVGEIKRAEGSPFFRPDRVAQVIEKIQSANRGPLQNPHVASIWREIMSACLALEAPQRVAVLGPQGTFCEQAAIDFFGSAANLIYCANFDEVFHATAAGTRSTAWSAWRTPPKAWWPARSTCSCDRPCTWWERSVCWCATTCCAR